MCRKELPLSDCWQRQGGKSSGHDGGMAKLAAMVGKERDRPAANAKRSNVSHPGETPRPDRVDKEPPSHRLPLAVPQHVAPARLASLLTVNHEPAKFESCCPPQGHRSALEFSHDVFI